MKTVSGQEIKVCYFALDIRSLHKSYRSVCTFTQPARTVGGDFYDCFMRDEKTVCIVMGDVSGKGITAAIFMVMAKTIIREKLLASLSPARALNEANDEFCSQNPENLFATVFAGLLDTDTGRLQYANAGHTHPVILGGRPELLVAENGVPFDPVSASPVEKDPEHFDSGGMGLSLIRQTVSSMTYKRENGRNVLTLCFALPGQNKAD